ncbi:acyl carrier protein [Saccharothrix sp. NRRL B-16314]|uniref:acyl carrier protein n=1 Tax=Saccharothrix sp. NRRL B-16314 TaxID=1463825 RepID=UPI000AD20FB1|nr:acyl carrier protein [Saccharothrix sp. NRRL B-16314]
MNLITVEEVEALIKREMRGKRTKDVVIDDTAVLRDLGLSSLQVAEIIFSLEETHGVEFDPEQAANARTLGDLIALGNAALSEKDKVADGTAR